MNTDLARSQKRRRRRRRGGPRSETERTTDPALQGAPRGPIPLPVPRIIPLGVPVSGPTNGLDGTSPTSDTPLDGSADAAFDAPLAEGALGDTQTPLVRGGHRPMSRPLEQRCLRNFSRGARARGRDYFVGGRISEPNRVGDTFLLDVRGNEGNYHVILDFSRAQELRALDARCDCPFYDGGEQCKHVWAALLQIDHAGLATVIPGSGHLRLLHAKPRRDRVPRSNLPHGERVDRGPRTEGLHRDARRIRSNGMPGTGIQPRGPLSPGALGGLNWLARLDLIQGRSSAATKPSLGFSGNWLAYFVINAAETSATGKLVLDLWTRDRQLNDDLGPLQPSRLRGQDQDIERFADLKDQEILSALIKTCEPQTFAPFGQASGRFSSRFTIDPILENHLIPTLATAGKLFLSRSPNGSPDDADRPLRLDRGRPWELELKVETAGPGHYRLGGILKRENETRDIHDPLCAFRSGFLLFGDRISRLADPTQSSWASSLGGPDELMIPRDQGDALLKRILLDPTAPRLTWPDDMGWTTAVIVPRPKGVFRPLGNDPTTGRVTLTVSFAYSGREVSLDEADKTFVDLEEKRVYSRNLAFEEEALTQAREILNDQHGTGTLPENDLHRVATELSRKGWTVYIENQRLRVADDFAMDISSSTDWFDLKLEASFDGSAVTQARLQAALEGKNGLVRLADGSLGMLPPGWLTRYASLSPFGHKNEDGTLRFSRSQGLMLNAVLTEEDHVRGDTGFVSFQAKIREFEGIKPTEAAEGFHGTLRHYQQEGVAWLNFIEALEAGGILADDMGLGKTIQVLAFLQARAKARGKPLPSLVVAPKSLVFNWLDETARFAPDLKVVRYAGAGRTKALKEIMSADLVITTYGTLRTDIQKLREVNFDVAIVDEAQAIKNPKSQAALACKQIRAGRKLALTGTPIENSLNDLFSILDFTSPGLLGHAWKVDLSLDTRSMLSRMLRPFVLRRTKEKVLTELPEKSEQVLFCEMSTQERQFYNGLRDHYRASLANEIDTNGLARSKIHVLEALLRLRQASCHPGLVNPELKSEPSAKLRLLLSHIQAVIQEGHKALVFSQFTSLLALVKSSLDQEGIVYEYLDGQTSDRKRPVERFQNDPDCPVFLISLKAGGVGLNLTAADYVFILDPWWNPAVEAQAIGRAHRIGQSQKVFAYRMIAQGTVEEKILELQKTKRELAESIISEDKDFLKNLTKEDLEMLLA
jgi:superfamily II DNA or RNA helicase